MKNSVRIESDGKYSQVTDGILVSVLPAPLIEESNPARNIYSFSYQVRVENLCPDTVELLERHWRIFSGKEQIGEVVGPGVVGVQPVIEPGQYFEYTSGAVIYDTYGAMEGTYTFRRENGTYFQVAIPRFDLFFPMVVH